MNRKGFLAIPILIIVALVIVVGAALYFHPHSTPALAGPTAQTSTVTVTTTTIQTTSSEQIAVPIPATASTTNGAAQWKTYTSQQFGFQFQYPSNESVIDEGSSTSQSGTQPEKLDSIEIQGNDSHLSITVYSSGIVQGDYGWPERSCGEWTFGPDDGPLSSRDISFADQKTLYITARNFGGGGSPDTNNYYCVNYPPNPIVVIFDQPPSSETKKILASFKFFLNNAALKSPSSTVIVKAKIIPTPPPTCTFSVSPSQVTPLGTQVTLLWSCYNANACSITDDQGDSWPNQSSTQGTLMVSPSYRPGTTNYTLRCLSAEGALSSTTIPVTVVAPSGIDVSP